MKTSRKHESQIWERALKQENELLKLKLAAEFGMTHSDSQPDTPLDPELENEWLNNIYSFEKAFAEHKRTSVYDYIGKPKFKHADELKPNEISSELNLILDIMLKNSVEFTTICEYEDELIYKFITEELFQHEMDDIRVEGMMCCFIYEEFHPNHEYDIRQHTLEFLEAFYSDECKINYLLHWLSKEIEFQSKKYSRDDFTMILMMIHEARGPFTFRSVKIEEIDFNLETCIASVKGNLEYLSSEGECKNQFEFGFLLEHDWWSIKKVWDEI